MRTQHILVLLAAAGALYAQQGRGPGRPGLTLTTTAFPDGGEVPPKFTQSVPDPPSFPMEWTNVPEGTISFALLMHDPDVARNKSTEDMLHWLVVNIPGTARELPEGVPAQPKLNNGAVQLKNGGGTVGYRGPGAPAAGPDHHYTVEIYALDTPLSLGPDATRADVLKAMEGHILGKGVMVGRFHRRE